MGIFFPSPILDSIPFTLTLNNVKQEEVIKSCQVISHMRKEFLSNVSETVTAPVIRADDRGTESIVLYGLDE